jgi:hypothetical protein
MRQGHAWRISANDLEDQPVDRSGRRKVLPI